MNFRFKTIRRTRNALNAQQIYWEIIKLKKYFRLKTLFGEEKQSEIIFNRKQLPYKYKTFDMSLYIEQKTETSNLFYYIAIGMSSFVTMNFLAKLIYDDHTRYWVSIRFPIHMKYFELYKKEIQTQYNLLLQKLELNEKELKGAVGFHNIKTGIINLMKSNKEQIDYQSSDKQIKSFDSFLEEQDNKVLKINK